jgi:hypothetical protein
MTFEWLEWLNHKAIVCSCVAVITNYLGFKVHLNIWSIEMRNGQELFGSKQNQCLRFDGDKESAVGRPVFY